MMCLYEIQGINDLGKALMVSQESFQEFELSSTTCIQYNAFIYCNYHLSIIYLKRNNVAAKNSSSGLDIKIFKHNLGNFNEVISNFQIKNISKSY